MKSATRKEKVQSMVITTKKDFPRKRVSKSMLRVLFRISIEELGNPFLHDSDELLDEMF